MIKPIPLGFAVKVVIVIFAFYFLFLAKYDFKKKGITVRVTKKPKGRFGKRERTCRNMLQFAFDKPFPSVRPDFLENPYTGKNLELDCYCEELGLAVEVQGRQHYKYTKFFHKSYKDFLRQKQRDQIKKDLCLINGIDLIEVPYWIRVHKIPSYLYIQLKKIGRL